jgi:hypothetical protein
LSIPWVEITQTRNSSSERKLKEQRNDDDDDDEDDDDSKMDVEITIANVKPSKQVSGCGDVSSR